MSKHQPFQKDTVSESVSSVNTHSHSHTKPKDHHSGHSPTKVHSHVLDRSNRINDLQERNERLEHMVSHFSKEIELLHRNLVQSQNEVAQKTSEITQLKKDVDNLNQQIQSTQSQLQKFDFIQTDLKLTHRQNSSLAEKNKILASSCSRLANILSQYEKYQHLADSVLEGVQDYYLPQTPLIFQKPTKKKKTRPLSTQPVTLPTAPEQEIPLDSRAFLADESNYWVPLDCLVSVPQSVYNPIFFNPDTDHHTDTSNDDPSSPSVPLSFIASLVVQLNTIFRKRETEKMITLKRRYQRQISKMKRQMANQTAKQTKAEQASQNPTASRSQHAKPTQPQTHQTPTKSSQQTRKLNQPEATLLDSYDEKEREKKDELLRADETKARRHKYGFDREGEVSRPADSELVGLREVSTMIKQQTQNTPKKAKPEKEQQLEDVFLKLIEDEEREWQLRKRKKATDPKTQNGHTANDESDHHSDSDQSSTWAYITEGPRSHVADKGSQVKKPHSPSSHTPAQTSSPHDRHQSSYKQKDAMTSPRPSTPPPPRRSQDRDHKAIQTQPSTSVTSLSLHSQKPPPTPHSQSDNQHRGRKQERRQSEKPSSDETPTAPRQESPHRADKPERAESADSRFREETSRDAIQTPLSEMWRGAERREELDRNEAKEEEKGKQRERQRDRDQHEDISKEEERKRREQRKRREEEREKKAEERRREEERLIDEKIREEREREIQRKKEEEKREEEFRQAERKRIEKEEEERREQRRREEMKKKEREEERRNKEREEEERRERERRDKEKREEERKEKEKKEQERRERILKQDEDKRNADEPHPQTESQKHQTSPFPPSTQSQQPRITHKSPSLCSAHTSTHSDTASQRSTSEFFSESDRESVDDYSSDSREGAETDRKDGEWSKREEKGTDAKPNSLSLHIPPDEPKGTTPNSTDHEPSNKPRQDLPPRPVSSRSRVSSQSQSTAHPLTTPLSHSTERNESTIRAATTLDSNSFFESHYGYSFSPQHNPALERRKKSPPPHPEMRRGSSVDSRLDMSDMKDVSFFSDTDFS
ncbi:hypothetical protein BLNAU_16887 [Blattamonas nauphoetae]|uniref:Uncharacterized protein n=1 Tax=Blattamonas nauphoetae TaxID=2049346 RepID=A0ABQ9X835_9EUKA|nr:hypothetical protein BLNAU_16887 [Blattamonas nauphoetae]